MDQSPFFSELTDNNGYFEFTNVTNGQHEVTASKLLSKGNFTERTASITVDENFTLDDLILPEGVVLTEPQSVSDRSLMLKWTATDAPDFREYKVYRHHSSGLDESTGALVHVATSITDTTFRVPDLEPLEEYFFRVFVMNQFGRLGGSNIISATTLNAQVILNGDFEIINPSTNFPENWEALLSADHFSLESAQVHSGNHAVEVRILRDADYLVQRVNLSDFTPNARYRLSYWIKHESMGTSTLFQAHMATEGTNDWFLIINQVRGPREASDWEQYVYEFTIPAGLNAANIVSLFYFETYGPDSLKAWIDDVRLAKPE
jgi:hypothetical protein